MTKLPVLPPEPDPLDRVTIATPCEVPWESLQGDDRIRHCGRCKQNVYNVAAMDRAEALRLLQSRTGRLCLRLYRRVDGTIVTADCWSRLRAARRRGRLAFCAALVVVGWAQLWAVLVGLQGLRSLWRGSETMGAAVPVQVTPPAPRAETPVPPPPVDVMMGEPAFVPDPPPAPPKKAERPKKRAPRKARVEKTYLMGGMASE